MRARLFAFAMQLRTVLTIRLRDGAPDSYRVSPQPSWPSIEEGSLTRMQRMISPQNDAQLDAQLGSSQGLLRTSDADSQADSQTDHSLPPKESFSMTLLSTRPRARI